MSLHASPSDSASPETPADRGIPSVASLSDHQKTIAAIVIGLAALAGGAIVISGMHNSKPPALTAHKPIPFKTQPGSAPYFAASPPSAPQDPLALQKERALQAAALRMAIAEQKQQQHRIFSPQLVYDQPSSAGTSSVRGQAGHTSPDGAAYAQIPGENSPAVAAQTANADSGAVPARQMSNLHTLIAQGTMIQGVLETAIQSDLPGMVRAIVSENVYGFDGTKLLIPKGSRLIGKYRSGLTRGQVRVFVIWNRLIRNDGVTINLDSYGADALGRAGLAGSVDTHFFERFGSSVMLSMIDSGLQAAANSTNNNASATVAINTGNDFSNAAAIALQNSVNIPSTVNIPQGTRITVFVGKDLDFSHVHGYRQAE